MTWSIGSSNEGGWQIGAHANSELHITPAIDSISYVFVSMAVNPSIAGLPTNQDVTFAQVQFVADTNGGVQDITIPNLNSSAGTVKAAIFYWSKGQINNSIHPHAGFGYGFTNGTDSTCCYVTREDAIVLGDNFTTSWARSFSSIPGFSTKQPVVYFGNEINEEEAFATFTAWIPDGIRITWSSPPTTPRLINCTLVTDAQDNLEVVIGTETSPSAVDTSTTITTSLTKEPELILTMSCIDGPTGFKFGNGKFSAGFCKNDRSGGVTQACYGVGARHSIPGPTEPYQIMADARSVYDSRNVLSAEPSVEFSNFTSNGWEAYARDSTGGVYFSYMAFSFNGLVPFSVETMNTPTEQIEVEFTSLGTTPQYAQFIMGGVQVPGNQELNGNAGSFGMGSMDEDTSASAAFQYHDEVMITSAGSIFSAFRPAMFPYGNGNTGIVGVNGNPKFTDQGFAINFARTQPDYKWPAFAIGLKTPAEITSCFIAGESSLALLSANNMQAEVAGISDFTSTLIQILAAEASVDSISEAVAVEAGGETGLKTFLGINPDPLKDYNLQEAFVDSVKEGRVWIPTVTGTFVWNSGNDLTLDVNGWPILGIVNIDLGLGDGFQDYPEAARMLFFRDVNGNYPTGTYNLTWDGDSLAGQGITVQGNGVLQNYDPVARTAQIVVTSPTDAGFDIRLEGPSAPGHIQNLKVIKPGYPVARPPMFTSNFLDKVGNFGVIRFMDFGQTNWSEITSWANRVTPDYYTFTRAEYGCSIEAMIELCNVTYSDMWYCIPHRVDDDYITQTAAMINAGLLAGLNIYIEYSNEVWNGTFGSWGGKIGQHTWVLEQAQASDIALDLGLDDTTLRAYWFSRRSVQIFDIFTAEVTSTARGLVRVMGSWIATAGSYTNRLLEFEDAYLKTDEVAVAPYFGGHWGTNQADVDTVLALGRAGDIAGIVALLTEDIDELFDGATSDIEGNLSRIAFFGSDIKMSCYEAGQHMVGVLTFSEDDGPSGPNNELAGFFFQTNAHPDMKAMYTYYIEKWIAIDGSLTGPMIMFSLCQERSRQGGSFGLLEYITQPLNETPKWEAVIDATGPSVKLMVTEVGQESKIPNFFFNSLERDMVIDAVSISETSVTFSKIYRLLGELSQESRILSSATSINPCTASTDSLSAITSTLYNLVTPATNNLSISQISSGYSALDNEFAGTVNDVIPEVPPIPINTTKPLITEVDFVLVNDGPIGWVDSEPDGGGLYDRPPTANTKLYFPASQYPAGAPIVDSENKVMRLIEQLEIFEPRAGYSQYVVRVIGDIYDDETRITGIGPEAAEYRPIRTPLKFTSFTEAEGGLAGGDKGRFWKTLNLSEARGGFDKIMFWGITFRANENAEAAIFGADNGFLFGENQFNNGLGWIAVLEGCKFTGFGFLGGAYRWGIHVKSAHSCIVKSVDFSDGDVAEGPNSATYKGASEHVVYSEYLQQGWIVGCTFSESDNDYIKSTSRRGKEYLESGFGNGSCATTDFGKKNSKPAGLAGPFIVSGNSVVSTEYGGQNSFLRIQGHLDDIYVYNNSIEGPGVSKWGVIRADLNKGAWLDNDDHTDGATTVGPGNFGGIFFPGVVTGGGANDGANINTSGDTNSLSCGTIPGPGSNNVDYPVLWNGLSRPFKDIYLNNNSLDDTDNPNLFRSMMRADSFNNMIIGDNPWPTTQNFAIDVAVDGGASAGKASRIQSRNWCFVDQKTIGAYGLAGTCVEPSDLSGVETGYHTFTSEELEADHFCRTELPIGYLVSKSSLSGDMYLARFGAGEVGSSSNAYVTDAYVTQDSENIDFYWITRQFSALNAVGTTWITATGSLDSLSAISGTPVGRERRVTAIPSSISAISTDAPQTWKDSTVSIGSISSGDGSSLIWKYFTPSSIDSISSGSVTDATTISSNTSLTTSFGRLVGEMYGVRSSSIDLASLSACSATANGIYVGSGSVDSVSEITLLGDVIQDQPEILKAPVSSISDITVGAIATSSSTIVVTGTSSITGTTIRLRLRTSLISAVSNGIITGISSVTTAAPINAISTVALTDTIVTKSRDFLLESTSSVSLAGTVLKSASTSLDPISTIALEGTIGNSWASLAATSSILVDVFEWKSARSTRLDRIMQSYVRLATSHDFARFSAIHTKKFRKIEEEAAERARKVDRIMGQFMQIKLSANRLLSGWRDHVLDTDAHDY